MLLSVFSDALALNMAKEEMGVCIFLHEVQGSFLILGLRTVKVSPPFLTEPSFCMNQDPDFENRRRLRDKHVPREMQCGWG